MINKNSEDKAHHQAQHRVLIKSTFASLELASLLVRAGQLTSLSHVTMQTVPSLSCRWISATSREVLSLCVRCDVSLAVPECQSSARGSGQHAGGVCDPGEPALWTGRRRPEGWAGARRLPARLFGCRRPAAGVGPGRQRGLSGRHGRLLLGVSVTGREHPELPACC